MYLLRSHTETLLRQRLVEVRAEPARLRALEADLIRLLPDWLTSDRPRDRHGATGLVGADEAKGLDREGGTMPVKADGSR